MSKYTTLYLDLDNTVLDFYASEKNAVKQLLRLHNLPSDDKTASVYSDINRDFWERFERGEIKKEMIFAGRFYVLLELLGCKGDPEKMADDYFGILAAGHDVMAGAEDVLKWIKSRGYTVCVTTNGIARTQYRRIEESGLKPYFDYVFVSEDAGYQKPQPQYFDYVMAHSSEKDKSRILVIGDSQSSDILGGINFGVDTCWINHNASLGRFKPTYEISSLKELKNIL